MLTPEEAKEIQEALREPTFTREQLEFYRKMNQYINEDAVSV